MARAGCITDTSKASFGETPCKIDSQCGKPMGVCEGIGVFWGLLSWRAGVHSPWVLWGLHSQGGSVLPGPPGSQGTVPTRLRGQDRGQPDGDNNNNQA